MLLVTGGDQMPVPDPESGILIAALAEIGIRAPLVPWDAPIEWSQSRLVVLRTPWDYIDRPEEFLAFVRATAAVTTVVNPAEVVAWNIHKGYLAELADRGIPVVPTTMVHRGAGSAVQVAARSSFEAEIVIKPAISAGAFRAIRTKAASSEAEAYLAALLTTDDALVQPYLAAVEAGETSLVYFDGTLSHAVRKVPAAGDFRVHVEYGGSVAPHTATHAERAVAEAVLDAAPDATTYARIDLVTTPDGSLLMEAELIDPELFFTIEPQAAARFAAVLGGHLR